MARLRKSQLPVREVADPRVAMVTPASRKQPKWKSFKYHTIHIPEQDGEQAWVDVSMSGTTPVERIIEEDKIVDGVSVKQTKTIIEQIPAGPFRLWIERGVDVANVPTWAVHILMETAVGTDYKQKEVGTRDGGKKMAFIPYAKKSYPCSILESYNEKKPVVDGMVEVADDDPSKEHFTED